MSSRLSPYFSSGVISVREVLQKTREWNGGAHFDEGDAGVDSWVREIVFREFYRHMMVITPHGSMNMPQNVKFDFVQWEDDEEGWKRWYDGTLGVPWVDAGMRQLNHEAYMHNRLRMITSSYLRANLLIDYRKGERYFAEHLVDWVGHARGLWLFVLADACCRIFRTILTDGSPATRSSIPSPRPRSVIPMVTTSANGFLNSRTSKARRSSHHTIA